MIRTGLILWVLASVPGSMLLGRMLALAPPAAACEPVVDPGPLLASAASDR